MNTISDYDQSGQGSISAALSALIRARKIRTILLISPWTTVEELRFSPGMFKKDAPDYFSYAFVAQLDNTSSISQQKVKYIYSAILKDCVPVRLNKETFQLIHHKQRFQLKRKLKLQQTLSYTMQ